MRPYSTTFTEHYWVGGLAEKEFVFLHGNALPQRFAEVSTFTVAEFGFGTALNFLLTAHLWQTLATSHLTYISYELEPLTCENLTTIHASFPDHLQPLSQAFLTTYNPQPGWNTVRFTNITLHLYIGDATTGITTQPAPADAWFLDGFSPARNPALWTPALLQTVTGLTNPHGTFATYSAVGEVRRILKAAGFAVKRRAGFPPKWHMLTGTKI